jgi:hypothetical protein
MKAFRSLGLLLMTLAPLQAHARASDEESAESNLRTVLTTYMSVIQEQVDAGDVKFDIDPDSFQCTESEGLETPNPIGVCIFSASGVSDSIDALFAVTVGDPAVNSPAPAIKVTLLSTLLD